MNVLIGTRDNHPIVAIMAFIDPPKADPFLMLKNFSKRKIRRREIRHVLLHKVHWQRISLNGLNMMVILIVINQRQ